MDSAKIVSLIITSLLPDHQKRSFFLTCDAGSLNNVRTMDRPIYALYDRRSEEINIAEDCGYSFTTRK
jgi:hypothetical protein